MKDFELSTKSKERENCPSVIQLLSSLISGELSSLEIVAIEEHVLTCIHCQHRLNELKNEREQFYKKHPVLNVESIQSNSWLDLFNKPALIGAFSLLLICCGLWYAYVPGDQYAGIQFKGGTPSVKLLVERDGTIFQGRSFMYIKCGDRIRFAYSIDEAAYLFIINIDNDGHITAYYPYNMGQSIKIKPGKDVFLSGSIRLDDYIGKERIFIIFSRKPLTYAYLKVTIEKEWEQLRSTSPGVENMEAIPITGYQETFLIVKEAK